MFDAGVVGTFFAELCNRFSGGVVCEPRHASWFSPQAGELLSAFCVSRVAADPAKPPEAAEPRGWSNLIYYRLHGSPRMYHSGYSDDYLDELIHRLREAARLAPVWCIFNNTASGAATLNALYVLDRLHEIISHG